MRLRHELNKRYWDAASFKGTLEKIESSRILFICYYADDNNISWMGIERTVRANWPSLKEVMVSNNSIIKLDNCFGCNRS